MEKDFIPASIALKLTSFGCDCHGYGYLNFWNGEWKFDIRKWYDADEVIKAILWQQAFDFFRKEKKLDSCVAPTYEDESREKIIYWYWIQGVETEGEVHFDSEEEAKYALLLDLVKIVEQQT